MNQRLITLNKAVAKLYLLTLFRVFLSILILALIVLLCLGCFVLVGIALQKIKMLGISSDITLKYIDSLKYPLIILFFGIFFQQPIRKFLNETDSIDTSIGKLSRKLPPQQEGDSKAVRALAPEADEAPGEEASEKLVPDAAQIENLLTSPAAIAEYHRIFSTIWGSQFEALKKLQSYIDGLAEDDLKEFLELHQARNPGSGYKTVNDLMQYPVSEILVKYEPQTKTYYLTYAGLYFLNYLRARGLYDSELLF